MVRQRMRAQMPRSIVPNWTVRSGVWTQVHCSAPVCVVSLPCTESDPRAHLTHHTTALPTSSLHSSHPLAQPRGPLSLTRLPLCSRCAWVPSRGPRRQCPTPRSPLSPPPPHLDPPAHASPSPLLLTFPAPTPSIAFTTFPSTVAITSPPSLYLLLSPTPCSFPSSPPPHSLPAAPPSAVSYAVDPRPFVFVRSGKDALSGPLLPPSAAPAALLLVRCRERLDLSSPPPPPAHLGSPSAAFCSVGLDPFVVAPASKDA